MAIPVVAPASDERQERATKPEGGIDMTRWMTADWTVGQLNALVKKIGDGNARGILDGTVEFAVTARAREFLRPAGVTTIPATGEVRDPHTRLKTREGLWVSPFFTENVLAHAHTVKGTPEIDISAWDLAKLANDAEIMGETGDPIDIDVLWPALDYLLRQQPGGEEGFLPTDGRWIVIHVRAGGGVFAVDVRWHAGGSEWDVHACPLYDARWYAGGHVISLATA